MTNPNRPENVTISHTTNRESGKLVNDQKQTGRKKKKLTYYYHQFREPIRGTGCVKRKKKTHVFYYSDVKSFDIDIYLYVIWFQTVTDITLNMRTST